MKKTEMLFTNIVYRFKATKNFEYIRLTTKRNEEE